MKISWKYKQGKKDYFLKSFNLLSLLAATKYSNFEEMQKKKIFAQWFFDIIITKQNKKACFSILQFTNDIASHLPTFIMISWYLDKNKLK